MEKNIYGKRVKQLFDSIKKRVEILEKKRKEKERRLDKEKGIKKGDVYKTPEEWVFEEFMGDWEIKEILDNQLREFISSWPYLKRILSSPITPFVLKEITLLRLKKERTQKEEEKLERLKKRWERIKELTIDRGILVADYRKNLTGERKAYDDFGKILLDASEGILSSVSNFDWSKKTGGEFKLDPEDRLGLRKFGYFMKQKAKEVADKYNRDWAEVYQDMLIKFYQAERDGLYRTEKASRATWYGDIIRKVIADISRGDSPYSLKEGKKHHIGTIDIEQHKDKLTPTDIETIEAANKYGKQGYKHLDISQSTYRKRVERIRKKIGLKYETDRDMRKRLGLR